MKRLLLVSLLMVSCAGCASGPLAGVSKALGFEVKDPGDSKLVQRSKDLDNALITYTQTMKILNDLADQKVLSSDMILKIEPYRAMTRSGIDIARQAAVGDNDEGYRAAWATIQEGLSKLIAEKLRGQAATPVK
jgi:hypothetical protein